jgi:rhodanese-related sulfurtransferase
VGGVLSDKLVDTVAAVISMGGTARDLAMLDVARHFSYFMNLHPIPLVAHVMLNKLEGKLKGISPFELNDLMQKEEVVLLDVRTESEFKMGTLPGAINIPLEELEARKDELDRQRNIVLISERGRRAYLAFVRLRQMGFERLSVLDGGLLIYPFA